MVSLGLVENSYSNSGVITQGLNRASRGLINLNNRLKSIALPVIALASLSLLPQAEAGPGAYAACVAACLGGSALVAIFTGGGGGCTACCCANLCAPLGPTPTP
ncbi:MAG: hypothetical protein FJZ61_00050 [Chlamydiae bacterium]|nr:hypothetical protein [Chlamydiota bacterium]